MKRERERERSMEEERPEREWESIPGERLFSQKNLENNL